MKAINKIISFALCAGVMASCTKGIELEEVPVSIQEEVGLDESKVADVTAREVFKDNVYQVNWDKYVEMLLESAVGKNFQNGVNYKNTTSSPVTIMGKSVAPGESMFVKNTVEAVYESGAPEDSVYVVHIFASDTANYKTPNKGHLFVESTFTNAPVKPVLVNPTDGKAQEIKLPVDIKRLIIGLYMKDEVACYIKRVGDAPELGKPADYSVPHRYIVENENNRPGKGKRQRLYEVRVQLL
ncbi:hypothetical protein [uncultured Parabacteroides sp.]|jgi:hypothetical protein|uniref:hypothetical protein n=1 Tax=uncultured Parabacteroides sp. TaxID=512312 RepID=UPI0025DD3596|nr:hypothetical protein [uncultured Parabacteroides sp.]